MNDILKKAYRYRLNILAGIFLFFGFIIVIKNSSYLIGFCFNSRTLDELSIKGLRSGICIKDELSYTYGNLGEIVGRKSTKIYVADIGKEHNRYMEMHVQQSDFYERDNDIDDLYSISMGNYRELESSKKVKLYAVVEKEPVLFYKYYSKYFNLKSDELKDVVSLDYRIRVVNPNDYKVNLFGGLLLLAAGGILSWILYAGYKKMAGIAKMPDKEESEPERIANQPNPVGLFSKGILEDRKIISIELIWDSGIKVFEDKDIIERIMGNLDNVVNQKDEVIIKEGSKLCTFTFQLEDCTYISFEIWNKPKVKSIAGFYYISENAYNDLKQIFSKEINKNNKEL